MGKETDKTLAEVDAELARRGVAPDSELARVDAELSRRRGRPLPANAGIARFLTGVAGAPVDTVENVLNLGRAGVGTAATAMGRPDLAPDLQSGAVGGSQWLQDRLRATREPGLSPDNPDPQSRLGTLQYDLTARGGFVPGGAIPAVASIVAEHTLGPQWAAPAALLPSAAGQVVRPGPVRPDARLLHDEGVTLTPGQRFGGTVKHLEDAATSVPVLGDAIKSAQARGMQQYTRAAINRALRPIGEELPANLTGNKAIEYAYGKLGDKYDELLPNLRGSLDYKAPPNALPSVAGQAAPASLREELESLRNLGQNLPEPQRGQLGRIIDKEIVGRFTPQGLAEGQTLKDIESKLGGLKNDFRRSDNYDVRSLGDAVDEMQGSLRRMVERVNPEYQGELQKINQGYASFKTTQRAASNPGAPEGVFTPAQLHRAVRASDSSKDKARFAEGNAQMQDLSIAGKNVLPSTVPDSGTPLRTALLYSIANPLKASALALPVGAASMAYTQPGMRAISALAEPRTPASMQQLIAQAIVAEQQANAPHGFRTLEDELGSR